MSKKKKHQKLIKMISDQVYLDVSLDNMLSELNQIDILSIDIKRTYRLNKYIDDLGLCLKMYYIGLKRYRHNHECIININKKLEIKDQIPYEGNERWLKSERENF